MKKEGIVLFFLLFSPMLWAQEWKKEKSKDGKVSVEYRVKKQKNASGKSEQIIEYKVSKTDKMGYQTCLEVLKDVARHKEFLEDTEESYRVNSSTETEWTIYYLIDSPWPLPDSDVVTKMRFEEKENEATFVGWAVPEEYKDMGLKRMQLNDIEYLFRDQGNGMVYLEIFTRIKPVVNAPEWLINSWFPDGPIDILEGIVEEVKSRE